MPERRKADLDYDNPVWVTIGKAEHAAHVVIGGNEMNEAYGFRLVEWVSTGMREYVSFDNITPMFGGEGSRTTAANAEAAAASARPSRKCRARPLSVVKQEEQEEQLKEMQPKKRRAYRKTNKLVVAVSAAAAAAAALDNKKPAAVVHQKPNPPPSYWDDTSESEGDDEVLVEDGKPAASSGRDHHEQQQQQQRHGLASNEGYQSRSWLFIESDSSTDDDDEDQKPKARETTSAKGRNTNTDNSGTLSQDAIDFLSSDDDNGPVAKPCAKNHDLPSSASSISSSSVSSSSMPTRSKKRSSAKMPVAKKPFAAPAAKKRNTKSDRPPPQRQQRQTTETRRVVQYCAIPTFGGGIQEEKDRNIIGIHMVTRDNGSRNEMVETGVTYKCGGESNFFAKRYRGRFPRQLQYIAMGTPSYQSVYRNSSQVFQLENEYKPMVSVVDGGLESTDYDEEEDSNNDEDHSDDDFMEELERADTV